MRRHDGAVVGMARNFRLSRAAEGAVRREAERTGRSHLEVIREAVDRYLGLSPGSAPAGELAALIATCTVRPPRMPYRKAATRILLPAEVTSADLLDRNDQI